LPERGGALERWGQAGRVTNTLYFGDNLHVLREHIARESADLLYLDPPFNSNANYNSFQVARW
jgi:16S rRNA G966 N2-methylase RsmD